MYGKTTLFKALLVVTLNAMRDLSELQKNKKLSAILIKRLPLMRYYIMF